MQPLVTLRKHRGQQIARLRHLVVQMPQQRRDRIAERARSRKLIDDALRRQFIQWPRIFGDLGNASQQIL